MEIIINGEKRHAPDGATVLGLLESLALRAQGVVVERNGEIVEPERFAATRVAAGDKLEIVRFVGGG